MLGCEPLQDRVIIEERRSANSGYRLGRKGLECKKIRIPWRMLALTVASSPYNKGPTKLIETQGMNS